MMRYVYIGLVVYFLGMVSGGALIAAMRSLVQRARSS
jgi:hypothetical protein